MRGNGVVSTWDGEVMVWDGGKNVDASSTF